MIFTFQYRKRYGLHAICRGPFQEGRGGRCFNTASGMDCMQSSKCHLLVELKKFQYRKRYGLHAMERLVFSTRRLSLFQYRKRYGLHAISRPSSRGLRRFNTASGMDCMQLPRSSSYRRVCGAFQYRKRYGLHAIVSVRFSGTQSQSFNTASGMDCMQYCLPEALETVSPEVGFLILTPFSRFSPKCAELFCREKCFERGLKPVIARALLSTKEI